MKAIITAAGLGTRSGLNGIIRKELLNIYDLRNGNIVLRPIIDVLIHKLNGMGIEEIGVILAPDDSYASNYIKTAYPAVHQFFQKEKNGFGDAILSARDFIGNEGFVVAAGDGIILNLESMKEPLLSSAREGNWMLFVMRVKNPERYGVAFLDQKKSPYEVIEVIEKPKKPSSNFALCAFYYLPPQIFNFISYRNGKAELTDAIGSAIKSGIRFSAVEVPSDSWVSVGTAEDYRIVLERTFQFVSNKR